MFKIVSGNRGSSASSVLILMCFIIFFPCLIDLARISNIILHRSGKGGLSYLVLDLRVKVFSLSSLSMLLVVGSS